MSDSEDVKALAEEFCHWWDDDGTGHIEGEDFPCQLCLAQARDFIAVSSWLRARMAKERGWAVDQATAAITARADECGKPELLPDTLTEADRGGYIDGLRAAVRIAKRLGFS